MPTRAADVLQSLAEADPARHDYRDNLGNAWVCLAWARLAQGRAPMRGSRRAAVRSTRGSCATTLARWTTAEPWANRSSASARRGTPWATHRGPSRPCGVPSRPSKRCPPASPTGPSTKGPATPPSRRPAPRRLRHHPAEAEAEAATAVRVLRDAADRGYRASDAYRTEPALDPLRARPDFRGLMLDLAFPADAFAPPADADSPRQ